MARKWSHDWSADEKLQLKVYTTAPALQFYSGNFLGGTPSRGTEPYADWQGLALESEFLPDSPNHPEWPQPDCFPASWRRVFQPDGISVYCRVIVPPRPRNEGLLSIILNRSNHQQTKTKLQLNIHKNLTL